MVFQVAPGIVQGSCGLAIDGTTTRTATRAAKRREVQGSGEKERTENTRHRAIGTHVRKAQGVLLQPLLQPIALPVEKAQKIEATSPVSSVARDGQHAADAWPQRTPPAHEKEQYE